MRKENKHDVREQRMDNIDMSTVMVLTTNKDILEPHVVPVVSLHHGDVNRDELLHTNTVADCIFTRLMQ